MAQARVLLSTLIASAAAAHGGPVVARRHAAALARRGHEVLVVAPSGEARDDGAFRIETYRASPAQGREFAPRRPDANALAALGDIIRGFAPDVVYDVHGPAWAVEAAAAASIPVVSMVGDYNWFCLQSFLVDSRLKRCSGPESADKCFACLDRNYPPHWRAAHFLMKPAAREGRVRLLLWDAVAESREYAARLRGTVAAFVVGDRQAHEFLVASGIGNDRIVGIPQGLPDEARASRRVPDKPGPGRTLRIGFVGRPHLDKGIHVLARAFDSLPETVAAELWIVHSELATPENLRRHFPSRARFEADLAQGRVKLLRPAAQDEVFDIMARVDVGVVPSIAYESPSLALLEFVAQRTPVVRSESRGMEHVIADGVNGRTFPYGDWRALAAILEEIAGDREVLERWRARLPAVSGDDEYARRLSEVFSRLTPSTRAREAAMS